MCHGFKSVMITALVSFYDTICLKGLLFNVAYIACNALILKISAFAMRRTMTDIHASAKKKRVS